jgi:hypothetical protein
MTGVKQMHMNDWAVSNCFSIAVHLLFKNNALFFFFRKVICLHFISLMMIQSIVHFKMFLISDHCLMASFVLCIHFAAFKYSSFSGTSHVGECSFLVAHFIVQTAYYVDLCEEICCDNRL